MRLLEYISGDEFVLTKDFIGDDEIPPYAILSHTWRDGQEVTLNDLRDGGNRKSKIGYNKIKFCGQQAKRDGLDYFWVDTCCIDKSNQVELQDAINSMFRWYQNATRCYVYLSDVSTAKRKVNDRFSEFTWEPAFRASRWFTRGWTLQELLAPRSVQFFSVEGNYLGDKDTLKRQISEITGIPILALEGASLCEFSVEERLSWTKSRQTTRKEDKAYSLLGIFGIFMSLIYGEGEENAFKRLRKKIGNHHQALLQPTSSTQLEKDQECIRHLRLTDPRNDKRRIEETKGGLLNDSYRWILKNPDFQQWRDDQQSRLLWIKGDPGKGKTMLLCGIINELEKKSKVTSDLLSYFFCQATDARINNATAVLRGLLYLLVRQQSFLLSHIRERYNDAGKALFEDANAWVALCEIFTNILQDPRLNSTYLVIDALDECITADLKKLLYFVAQQSSTSSRVKWIVSSRNWPTIEEQLEQAGHKVRLSLELNAESVSAAVSNFIEQKVSQLAQQKKYDDRTRDAVLDYLASNANNTFLWVALVCQNLEKIPRWNVLKKLNTFPPGLDSLYQRMMQQIKEIDDADLFTHILALVAIVYRPITIKELVSLAEPLGHIELDSVREIISCCGSLLTVQEDIVYFVHQSVKDFLLTRVSDKIYPSGSEAVHYGIFLRSLQVMSTTLQRDMYNLRHLGYPIERVEQPDPDPFAASRYSCIYWAHHLYDWNLKAAEDHLIDLQDGGELDKFLRKKFLNWLEALSLCKSMSEGAVSIIKLEAIIRGKMHASKLLELIRDARRFILYHKPAIEISPLQTYASALLFSPTCSLIREIFKEETPDWLAIKPIGGIWGACLQTLEGHSVRVESVTFSHDSNWLASASFDGTVKIWDANTGELLQTLNGDSNRLYLVAFAYDSKRLASGSLDGIVKIWDASSGECLHTLKLHNSRVELLAFSHDLNQLATVFTSTVNIWDTSSGKCLQTLKSTSVVFSIAFSHESAWLASGMDNGTTEIWDAISGECLQTLKGSNEPVDSVAFSHNSKWLASASYDAVKIYDTGAGSGECLQMLDSDYISLSSITFSHDSTRLAIGSADGFIWIWDVTVGSSKLLQTLQGHASRVQSVAFSHDSNWLASSSDDMSVKIWDTATSSGECLQTLEGHYGEVTSVAISHDSNWLASTAFDGIVKIWDSGTGKCLQTFEDDVHYLNRSVAFSHNSKWLASASHEALTIWDTTGSGECLRTLNINSGISCLAAFSHDSTWLAVASEFGVVKIWDITGSGKCLQTLKVFGGQVRSIAFSHNLAWLALASDDKTVKIWDIGSGKCLQTLSVGKTPLTISFDATDSRLYTDIGTFVVDASRGSSTLTTTLDIIRPQSTQYQGLSLSSDWRWITYNSENLVWLPQEYRPDCSAISEKLIGIGVRTGRIWMCSIKPDDS